MLKIFDKYDRPLTKTSDVTCFIFSKTAKMVFSINMKMALKKANTFHSKLLKAFSPETPQGIKCQNKVPKEIILRFYNLRSVRRKSFQ